MEDEQKPSVGRFRAAARKVKRILGKENKRGPHRRSRQKIHSGTARPTGSSSGGTPPITAGGTASFLSIGHTTAFAPVHNPFAGAYSERSFKNAGIRAGVVKGYRGWYVDDCALSIQPAIEFGYYVDPFRESQNILRLLSTIWHHEWPGDGQPMVGDPDKHERGVYSFKAYTHMDEYAFGFLNFGLIEDRDALFSGFMVGEVESWGDIYEHELGYRAQFCRPTKFLSYYPMRNSRPDVIHRLCEKYKVKFELYF